MGGGEPQLTAFGRFYRPETGHPTMTFAMDRICSMCQAGVPHDCGPKDDIHPDDRGVCIDCGEPYNRRGARLGSDRCPRCDRRNDEEMRRRR